MLNGINRPIAMLLTAVAGIAALLVIVVLCLPLIYVVVFNKGESVTRLVKIMDALKSIILACRFRGKKME